MQNHIKNLTIGATGSTGMNETRYEALRVKIITTHSNGTNPVFPGCQDIKQPIMDGVEQIRTPQHQLSTHKHQNDKTTQSAINCIIALCELHAKHLQPPKHDK